MPHPFDYVGGQDEDLTRSIDVVHIEPSIREGIHLVSSIYGRGASLPLTRFGPLNTTAPWITGDPRVPNLLSVQTGQWSGSPSPDFEYQWMSNGVDIPGAVAKNWLSEIAYEGTTITVEVKGINYLGESYALTPGFDISLLEPIELRDDDITVITGLESTNHQSMLIDPGAVLISGIGAEDRLDVNRGVAYMLTGLAAETREDINAANIAIIQGLSQAENQTVWENPGIAVISYKYGAPLIDGVLQRLDIKNYDAELGSLAWTAFGVAGYVGGSSNEGGLGNFWGGADVDPGQLNQPYTYLYQDVPIYEEHYADVDTGLMNFEIHWHQYSSSGLDQGNIRAEFYAANDTKLGETFGPGLWASPSSIWFKREWEAVFPTNTRYVRIFLEFNWQSGENNDARIDAIYPYIRKGAKITSRSYGPDFKYWRLNCYFANAYQGTALSELEFRDVPGGADMAVGGSPIFGSVGLGVTDADFAFDDLRNTGYWAGELLGVPNGTAWIGYDFPAPVFPQEINLTARSGGFSNQMGRSFMLEGSEDGELWHRVQRMNEEMMGGIFSEGEQRGVEVPYGNIPFYKDVPGYNGYDYKRSNSMDDRSVGAIFKAHSRLNIDKLAANLQPDSAPFNYRMSLYRLNQQKNGIFGNIGMITGLLEHVDTVSDGVVGWKEIPLLNSHAFEIDDLFLVLFQDTDFTNNHDTNFGEQRIYYIEDTNGGQNPHQLRRVAERVGTWRHNNTSIFGPGYVNPTSFNGGGIGTYWAVDFGGTIF